MTKRSRAPSTDRRRSGDAFLAALSHELRTPLNGVLGMAQLLAHTPLDADQKAYVSAIEQSGEHLLGLVNDVLDLARLDSGGFQLHPAPTDLEDMLQSTAELLSPRAHVRGLEIAWAAEPGLPPVMTDEGRLRQILFNLAGNAVKFTETGGVLMTAERARSASEDGLRLRFSIRDTGPGVAEADRERIFQPFTQGPASLSGQIESTGLGLAIVTKLAEAFGGQVGIDAPEGGGACFWFEAGFEALPASGASEASLKGQEVLIVSANPVVAEAASRQVRACGGKPVFSTSAADSARHAPALVDYAKTGRRRPQPVPGHPSIVLIKPEERSRLPALRRAGFEGYLIKPLRRRSLCVRVLAVARRAATAAPVQAEDDRIRASAGLGARVLLAEDNPINAMLGRALLEREGCTVDRAQTGPQAVEAALSQTYDLILLDLRMPGMDGMEAARAIRAAGVTAPIAALTADAFEDTRHACLKAGMDDFLTKPLDSGALRALIVRAVGQGFTAGRGRAKLAS